jgi:hypothetical protein
MSGFNAFLAALAVALAIAVAGLAHALVQCPPYCVSAAAETSSGIQTAGSDDGCGKCRTQTQQGEAEGKEFWSLLGYKLKVTDTLLVAFTLVLALATGLLWRATDKLVEGAEKTAERQLRAYIHIEKAKLTFVDDKWILLTRIRNFGQTPAHDVRWARTALVVDWNGGNPTLRPPGENETDQLGSMGPREDYFEAELLDDPKDKTKLTDLTVTANADPTVKATPATKALFLVGTIKYKTVFGSDDHTTNFKYYIGGDVDFDFKKGGSMSADRNGNGAT